MIKRNMFFRFVLLTAILSLGWQTAFANSQEKRKAYIALSPGSFSDESINSIDESRASWLFIKSANERARTLKDLFPRLREKSKLAQTMEVSGDKHATDILDSSPELSEILAIWFKYHLQGAAKVDPLRE